MQSLLLRAMFAQFCLLVCLWSSNNANANTIIPPSKIAKFLPSHPSHPSHRVNPAAPRLCGSLHFSSFSYIIILAAPVAAGPASNSNVQGKNTKRHPLALLIAHHRHHPSAEQPSGPVVFPCAMPNSFCRSDILTHRHR